MKKSNTSVIIDGIFLEKAVDKTIETYSGIWPEKKFIKPDLNSVICNILDSYDKFTTDEMTVYGYLLVSESFNLGSRITTSPTEQTFITNSGNQVNVTIEKTDEISWPILLEQLDRLSADNNIIFVADDPIYESALNELNNKEVEIVVVMFNERDGGNMSIDSEWGDILYPMGISIGLERDEL